VPVDDSGVLDFARQFTFQTRYLYMNGSGKLLSFA
jgi:hypothetical protein